ncbi:Crp/Fnr family transcriptional regulator [Niveibacterium sp. 24ML]|uniref:Crp/Fnr family transcriptional regulator n=1 Tax=Niveibacterium sp. 24ML TaxID=2985512 RepID=UPI00226DCD71|nr:Crp/Fnr family transcriptional regulator [Niveibacterium sp. 24ML]MCX9157891.1 Crp/Fnr family transcriptional regulator [Niveibacterium sp. 24ML]
MSRDTLALYPALDALTPAARARLLLSSQQIKLPAGAQVFDEHQRCGGFPFVLEGAIRVIKRSPQGRELPLYRVMPGETCIVSTGCLLGHTDYNASGVTERDTTLLVLPQSEFESLLAEAPFRDFIFSLFSERIADLMQLIEEVAFRRLDARLASHLLGHGRMLHVTHQQLADELGSVREIVTRLLKGFADQGLVRLSREQIELIDPAGLRRIAGDPGAV